MKARVPLNAKLQKAYREAAFKDLYKSLQYNKAIDIIALHLAFGFGPKRIHKYIEAIADTTKLLNGWRSDGILKEKLTEVFYNLGINYKDFFTEEVTIKDAQRQQPKDAEVTHTEKIKVIDLLKEYKHFVENANKDL